MARVTRVVSTVTFTEDGGIVINFMDPVGDVRNRDLLMMSHQILIGAGEGGRDYGDEIEEVRDAVDRLLTDALEDFHAPPEDVRE